MRFRVMRGFCLGGGRDVYPGDHVELSEKEATEYLTVGHITPAPESTPAPATSQSTATSPDPGSEALARNLGDGLDGQGDEGAGGEGNGEQDDDDGGDGGDDADPAADPKRPGKKGRAKEATK